MPLTSACAGQPDNHSSFGIFKVVNSLVRQTVFQSNASIADDDSNVTDTYRCPCCVVPSVAVTPWSILLGIFPAMLSVCTIMGNSFVLVAICSNRRLNKKSTSMLILNLAMADLFVGFFIMPLATIQVFTSSYWIFGRLLCRIWTSLDVICCTASILTLCIISVDRFFGVTQPLQYQVIVTKERLLLSIVVVWTLSTCILLFTLRWKEPSDGVCDWHCSVGSELRYILHSVVGSFFIPLIVILIVYFRIYQITRRREQSLVRNFMITASASNLASNSRSSEMENRQRTSRLWVPLRVHYGGIEDDVTKQRRFYAKHKKSAKTLGLVVGAFLFCWTPFFSTYLIGYANSTMNPVIYALSMKAFSATFRNMLADKCWGPLCSKCDKSASWLRTVSRRRRWSRSISSLHSAGSSSESEQLVLVPPYAHHRTHYQTIDGQAYLTVAKTRPISKSSSWMTLKLYRWLVSTDVTDL